MVASAKAAWDESETVPDNSAVWAEVNRHKLNNRRPPSKQRLWVLMAMPAFGS